MKHIQLNLYYFPSCPFCQYVLAKINQLNLDVEYSNIHEDITARDKLFQDTGRYTVPCLYIDGEPMHESSDIMRWLEENQEKLKKVQWKTGPSLALASYH